MKRQSRESVHFCTLRSAGRLLLRGLKKGRWADVGSICVVMSIFLTACASFGATEDTLATQVANSIYATQTTEASGRATETQIASNIFATQTANAPTMTPTPLPTFTYTPTSSPTPTLSPTPSPTATATPSPTSTPTPTPVPDAIVKAKAGNLRAGPGTNYDILGKVTAGQEVEILSKSPGGNLVKVNLIKGNDVVTGWLWVKLLVIHVPLELVVVETNIPPTPTPRATPTPRPTPVPRLCRPGAALVRVSNKLDATLTLVLRGPEYVRFILAPNESRNYCFVPGDYNFTALAPGYESDTGRKTFVYEAGSCECWNFYFLIPPFGCDCPTDPADYVPPPLSTR